MNAFRSNAPARAARRTGSAVRKSLARLARHGLVHGVMPAVNFVSRRAYVQSRPLRHAERIDGLRPIEKDWEHGLKGSYRGDYARLHFLIDSIETLEASKVEGAFAELGVYRGNTAKVLHRLAPHRKLYLLDTFSGFPAEQLGQAQPATAGGYGASLEAVRSFVGEHPNLVYCPGVFPASTSLVPEHAEFALVHLDCDLEEPTAAALEFFYPRLVPGGFLIVHDYGSGCWPGVRRALDRFLHDKPEGLIPIPDKSGSAAVVRLRTASSGNHSHDRNS